jgi:hypothetical protein
MSHHSPTSGMVLFVTLCAYLALVPLLGTGTMATVVGSVAASLMLVCVFNAARPFISVVIPFTGVFLGALLATWLCTFWLGGYWQTIEHVVVAGFILWAGASLLQHALKGRIPDREAVATVVSVFLLLGIAWAHGYLSVAAMVPDALIELATGETIRKGDFFYFSFSTLTTLGYGDIVARHPVARSLAMTEGVIGVLFIAVLIARFVGTSKGSPPLDSANCRS